jgi:hypothetical protein
MAIVTVVGLVPFTGMMVGCEKDESKEILEENFNPNVVNPSRRSAIDEELAEDAAAQEK